MNKDIQNLVNSINIFERQVTNKDNLIHVHTDTASNLQHAFYLLVNDKVVEKIRYSSNPTYSFFTKIKDSNAKIVVKFFYQDSNKNVASVVESMGEKQQPNTKIDKLSDDEFFNQCLIKLRHNQLYEVLRALESRFIDYSNKAKSRRYVELAKFAKKNGFSGSALQVLSNLAVSLHEDRYTLVAHADASIDDGNLIEANNVIIKLQDDYQMEQAKTSKLKNRVRNKLQACLQDKNKNEILPLSLLSATNILDKNKIIKNGKVNEVWVDLGFNENVSNSFLLDSFTNGKYRFLIIHQDSRVFSNRKTLMLFFGKLPEKVRKNKGLVVADINKQAFCYMGGGIQKGDTYYQDFYIEIDEVIKKSELFFYSTVEGFKIDSLLIENCALEKVEYNQPIKEATRGWSDINLNKINTDAIEFLLYADINANVVDGSSVWFSSMASILASKGKTAIIIKENLRHTQVVSNIENSHNVELVTPEKIGFDGVFDIEKGVELLRKIDDISPNIRVVVVRGCEVAYRLSETRQFYNRLASYITDFYTVNNTKLVMNEEKIEKLKLISLRSVYMLAQTQLIKNKINELTDNQPKYIDIPPPINDKFFEKADYVTNKIEANNSFAIKNNVLKIGYAGKITPGWGVFELFEFVENLRDDGVDVELYMAANKISSSTNLKEFRQDIQNWFKKLDVKYYNNFNREQSLEMLSKMDFIWCFRPADFENSTLELSTKLVESVAIGGKCLCYPSAINIESLGKDYPFFIKDYDSFKSVLNKRELQLDAKFPKNIWHNHSLKNISENFHSYFPSEPSSKSKMLFTSHDFKFIDAYISYLKSKQVPVKKEIWEWGGHKNEKQLVEGYKWADKIFCEWGLANAVWYSKNNQDNKPVYIRMHAQEIRERAQKFGRQIDTNNIEKIIFVSENIREQAINLFGYQKEQTKFIPNFVMDDEFYFSKRKINNNIVLGLLGFVPQTKRLDRAVLLLDALRKSGVDARLSVKGHRPEELEFMHAPSRVKELDYYYDTYKMIDNLQLNDYVDFEEWGANVRDWYEKVDVILSPSENESFHYAVADGVLSGCLPVVWNWDEAIVIYPKDWVVSNISEAHQLVKAYIDKNNINTLKIRNRESLISNFGHKKLFTHLNKLIV